MVLTDQGRIMACGVTDSHEQDPSQAPELLSQIEWEIDRFIGDGMYDQAPVYAAVVRHSPGAQVIIPPRKDAVLSPDAATSPTQRDQHITSIEWDDLLAWKRISGYYAQAHAENIFFRYKRTFGSHLRAKRQEAQEREEALACELLNRMRELSRPQSYPVN